MGQKKEKKLLLRCKNTGSEGLHRLGGPDGRVKAAIVDGADCILDSHGNGWGVAGQSQIHSRMSKDGEGADLVVREAVREKRNEHSALA